MRRDLPFGSILASGIVLSVGYAFAVALVAAASKTPGRDLLLVTALFLGLGMVPYWLLRPPKPIEVPLDRPPPRKKQRPWWQFWKRKRKRAPRVRMWKRLPGQEKNRPWGSPERPSVFVPARGRGRSS